MSNHEDFRSDLENWQNMWDQMEKEGVHPEPEAPNSAPSPQSYGQDDPTDTYYSYFDDQHGQDGPQHTDTHGDALLQEDKQKTPNPVYPDSVGPDYLNTKPVWVKEDAFKQIEELKGKLFDVENRLAKEMGGGDKWVEKCHHPSDEKLMSEIESLRKRIEKVSSTLGVEDEASPWVVQRD